MSDTLENTGLKLFMNNALRNASTMIDIPIVIGDSAFMKRDKFIDIKRSGEHFIPKYISRWHQDAPFNDRFKPAPNVIPQINYPAGCTAIAIGQVMGYYKWPQTYFGSTYETSYNWNDIENFDPLSYNKEDISQRSVALTLSQLMYDIGRPENMNIKYDFNGSGGSLVDNLETTLLHFNYTPCIYRFFSTSTEEYIMDQIDENPIIAAGTTINWNGEHTGHAWVIDAYKQYALYSVIKFRPKDDPSLRIEEIYSPLYHCVWGWRGNNNGYFNWDIIDGKGYFQLDCPEEYWENDIQQGCTSSSFFSIYYFSNIKPNK